MDLMMKAARYIIVLFIFFCLFPAGWTQVTIFPEIDKIKKNQNVEIKKVKITPEFTIIDFYFASPESSASTQDTWICVNKSYYITPSGVDDRKYLVLAKNITICPKSTKVNTIERNDIEYKLYFPPIGPNIYKIDIIEKKSGGKNFFGVHLNSNRGRAMNDSARFHSQEAFRRFFLSRIPQLDSLEGLWKIKITRQHFISQNNLLDEEKEKPEVIAIIKKDGVFFTYSEKGKNLREYFKKLSGNRGYFFRKEIPEVESESSGYIVFSDHDHFFIRYTLPDRMAHYYLLKDYVPGDRVDVIAQYERINMQKTNIKPDILKISTDTVNSGR